MSCFTWHGAATTIEAALRVFLVKKLPEKLA